MMSLFEKIKAKLFRENNAKNQKNFNSNDEGLKELQKMALRIQLDKEIKNASIQDKQEVKPVEKPVEESTDKKLTKEELKELEQIKKELVEILRNERSSGDVIQTDAFEYKGKSR